MRALIVDDEPLACERLRALLAEIGGIELAGVAHNGSQALRLVSAEHPDLLLLDVRMPGMDGLEVARHLSVLELPPAIVFTTAYDEYAVQAFDAQAIDYLLKPVRKERLAAALERARRLGPRQLAAVQTLPAAEGETGRPRRRTQIAIRVRDGLKLVTVADVYFFSADRKYTTVRHRGGSDLIEESLRSLEEELAPDFARVHRNALVNTAMIAAIERQADGQHFVRLRDLDDTLQVSRRLAGELRELLQP